MVYDPHQARKDRERREAESKAINEANPDSAPGSGAKKASSQSTAPDSKKGPEITSPQASGPSPQAEKDDKKDDKKVEKKPMETMLDMASKLNKAVLGEGSKKKDDKDEKDEKDEKKDPYKDLNNMASDINQIAIMLLKMLLEHLSEKDEKKENKKEEKEEPLAIEAEKEERLALESPAGTATSMLALMDGKLEKADLDTQPEADKEAVVELDEAATDTRSISLN